MTRDEGVLVAIPVFGSPEVTDAMLRDLTGDRPRLVPEPRIVVVDNAGDYQVPDFAPAVELYRPGRNLRWIGATNWALRAASDDGHAVCVVLNNDIRLSRGFLAGLVAPFAGSADIAIVGACYDDFWLHQRATTVPTSAAAYRAQPVLRDVGFVDGTALAFSVAVVERIGLLDEVAFPRHGYGSDVDFALRARAAGFRCVVTEEVFVSHLRRVSMTRTGQTAEQNRAEILAGLDGKWGSGWRERVGLGPGAFPPHNTGSAASWYL